MIKTKIRSTEKYLTSKIVNQCFLKGKVTNVDKQVCGNGFSTAFLNLAVKPGCINIIIAPNKAVLIEKQSTYLANKHNFKNRVKFFFKESKDEDFSLADVFFFVADSFLLKHKSIANISHKIDKVLIDENHSTEQQTAFRYNLVDFESKVKKILYYPDIAIVKVTATPNHFSRVDIIIDNDLIEPKHIIHTKDRQNALKRIKLDIKKKENIVVFTNCATLIYHLRNYKSEVTANFVIGDNLKRSLVELITVIEDAGSNLTIASSRGFEGFDINYDDAKVYYFEDRSRDYESFHVSNLYQAISRTRKGAKYIEYCRQELSNKRLESFKDIDKAVDLFINSDQQSIENKQKTEHKKYHKYVIFNQDSNGKYSIKRNEVAIELNKEKRLFDKPFPGDVFKPFLVNRKITIDKIEEVNNRLTKKVRESQKIKNLFNNKNLIEDQHLFDDSYTIKVMDAHSHLIVDNDKYRLIYLKQLQSYLRRKNYNNLYEFSERESKALELLKNVNSFYKLVSEVTKAYDVRSIKKYGLAGSEKHRREFKEKSINTVALFIIAFTNKKIYLPHKWVANRNYNLATKIGLNEIKLIASRLKIDVLEIDAKNCFSRIVYGLCGKKLPDNFYGKDKINKRKINIFLNNFFYDNKKGEKKFQKQNAIRKFIKFGFDQSVINYLILNFFECKYRGDLFAKLSYHEKRIITATRDSCIDLDNSGIIRRHDSIIVFDNKSDLSFLNYNNFLDVPGWFNVDVIEFKSVFSDESLIYDSTEFNESYPLSLSS